MAAPTPTDRILRGVLGGILGAFFASLIFLLLFRFSHSIPEEMAVVYSLTPAIFFRYLGVGVYLGFILGLSESLTQIFGRGISPVIYTVVGTIGLLRFYLIDGYPGRTDVIYVFFTFPDDLGTGVTCLILLWMIILGIIRRYAKLSVWSGSFVESAVIFAFILKGMSNRWLFANHYELFSSAFGLWVLLVAICFCQRMDNGV